MKLLNELQDLLAAALNEDDNTNHNDDVTTASTLQVTLSLGATLTCTWIISRCLAFVIET